MIYNYNNYLHLIFEGINEIDELYILADEIIEYFSFNYKEIEEEIEADGYMNYPLVKMIYNTKNYKTLVPFFSNFKLTIEASVDFNSDKMAGVFIPDKYNEYDNEGSVLLNYGSKRFKDSLERSKKKYNNIQEAYKNSLTETFKLILVHEIQHAYDYFRSESNFRKNKQTYKYNKKYSEVELSDDVKQNDAFFRSEDYQNTYLKLPHEVWARFSETVGVLDYNKPFNDVLNDFKKKLRGYDILSDNQKKRIKNTLYKYYDTKKGSN